MMEEWKELFGKYYWIKFKQRLKEEGLYEKVRNRDYSISILDISYVIPELPKGIISV